MSIDNYDRDGNPLPADWYDTTKHGHKYKWGTERRIARTVVGDITGKLPFDDGDDDD